MSSLSALSIRRPVLAWMLMSALIIFGCISFQRLGVSQLPDVDFPVVSVSLSLPGAAPQIIEGQVLDILEDSIMQIGGIRKLTSNAQQSSGNISVEFELNRDINQAVQEIQNKISQVQNMLPVGLAPPTVRKSNPEDQPILWLTLTNNDPKVPVSDMMIYARNFLLNQFSMVSGVGNVVQAGYVDPSLRVWVDHNRLDRFDFTTTDIINAIRNEHIEMPLGRIENDQTEYNLRVMSEAQSPDDFSKIRITSRQGQGINYRPFQLGQFAHIEEGTVDIRKISRSNGVRSVGLGIIKQHGSNAVEVAQLVRNKLDELKPIIPKNYQLIVRSDNTRFIKESVRELVFTLFLSALLTSIVCFFFLGSWSSTLNVLMAIPTSIIGTFIAFYAFHFTLNTFTLLGLSLAIGIVVDDAIMMLENIVRKRELGETKRQAALKGAQEITFAAVAATIAVVAIFIPVVFMKGVIGRYFLQYGVTVTAAVLLSLLEALTLTPMRCSRYLNIDPHPKGLTGWMDQLFTRFASNYAKILNTLLNHRWKTIGVTLSFFFMSLLIARHVPGEMIPPQDQSMMMMRFKLPVGTALAITDEKIKQVEEYLLKQPEVAGVFSAVGGFGGDAVNQGNAFVTLVDKSKRKMTQAELITKFRTELRARIGSDLSLKGSSNPSAPLPDQHSKPSQYSKRSKGMELTIQDMSLRGFAPSRGFPVEFIIQGPDWNQLTDTTAQIMSEMKKSNGVTDVNTDIQDGMPEAQIIPNRVALAKHGVSLSSVTQVMNALIGGAILNKETQYPKAGNRYAIEVRLVASQRQNLLDLNRIKVRNNRGQRIPLSELVDIQVKPSMMLISRLDRARAITVYANPAPGHSQQEALRITENLARQMLPPGYSIKMTGSSQSFMESFHSLLWALALGVLVSYMVLASQFNSFIHPIAVLMALPFSIAGAFLGLWLGHQSINMFSLIGFILLMGIVKKNSILLVDFTNHCRSQGDDVRTALLKACPIRLRPIIMTSVATVAGAIPSALNFGPGAETRIPMAVSIIGGVTVSTVLTLFVVPCVYSILTRFERHQAEEAETHN